MSRNPSSPRVRPVSPLTKCPGPTSLLACSLARSPTLPPHADPVPSQMTSPPSLGLPDGRPPPCTGRGDATICRHTGVPSGVLQFPVGWTRANAHSHTHTAGRADSGSWLEDRVPRGRQRASHHVLVFPSPHSCLRPNNRSGVRGTSTLRGKVATARGITWRTWPLCVCALTWQLW